MKKKYSLKDIAERSGVSIGTVDRVIHNRGRVSKSSIEKVNSVLEELDYTPNPMARSLRNNTIHKIGVLIPDPKKDAYWIPCETGINEVIREFKAFDVHVDVKLFDPSKPRSFSLLGNRLLENLPNAMLLVPLFEQESARLLDKLEKSNVPTATFNSLPKTSVKSYVGQDLVMSGRVAAKLIQGTIGKTSEIAVVHIDESINNAVHMRDKEDGFKSYFADTGQPRKIHVVSVARGELVQSLENLVRERPKLEGVFVTNSKTYEVVWALEKIGRHAKLVGYDLLPENVACLKNGQIEFLIHQTPKTQASLSLKGLIETLLFRKEVPKAQLLPIGIINSENVGSYL